MSWLSNLIKVNLDPFSTPSERLRALGPEQESQPLNVGDKAKTDAAIPILVGNQHVRLSPIQVFKRMDDAEEQVGLALVWCLGPVSNMRAYARLYANDTISTDDVFAYDPNSPDTSYLAYSHFAGAHDQLASGWQTFRDKFGWKEDCHGRGITYSLIKYFRNPDVFEQEPQFYIEVAKGNLTHIDGTSNQPDQYADNPVAWARWLLQDKTVGFAFSDSQIGESFDTLRDWIYNTRVKRYTGESGDHPRFTVNGTLAGRDKLKEKITKIEDHCFGKVVWTGEKAEFVIKGLQTQHFLYLNKDNVIGKVTKRGIAASDKLNRVVCKWVNPEKNFEEDQVCYPPVGDPLYDQWLEEDDYQEKEDTIERPLCFNAYEALKHAEVEVKESREMFEVELTVGPEGSQLTQWDVVAYTDEDRGWTDKLFLVHKIDDKKTDEAEQYVLTLLAYNPTIYEWSEQGEYVFDAPYDKSLKRYPAPGNVVWNNATRTLTWDAIPDAILSRYIVTIDGKVVSRPAGTSAYLPDLQPGTYEYSVTGEGVFKSSFPAVGQVVVGVIGTPTLLPQVTSKPGYITVIPPEVYREGQNYEFRYHNSEDSSVISGGFGQRITISNVVENVTYYIEYRILTQYGQGEWIEVEVNGIEKELFTWVAYADDVNGTNISTTFASQNFYGIATGRTVETVSLANPSVFKWFPRESGAPGEPAISAVLSNDSVSITTDKAGENGDFSTANTTIKIYTGPVDDTAAWTISTSETNVTGSLSGTTYTATALEGDAGYVDFNCSRNGYASITKRFSLAKSRKGDDGVSVTVIDNGDGTYTIVGANGSITVRDGSAGEIPTITDNGDGTYTISNGVDSVIFRDGENGETPVKGVDYFDGNDGDYVSFIYRNAASQPSTPTGGSFDGSNETFPSGATDTKTTPPAGQKRWVSTVRYKDNGNGTWSRRTAWSSYSEDFERGEDGASGKDGLTPDDVQGVAGQVWGFTEDGDYLGWNLVNLNNSSVARGALHATATTNDPYIEIDGLSIVGADNYGIKLRLRTSSATFDTSAQFYWETSAHGINSNYRCEKVISYTQNEWTYLIFDIRDAVSTSARDDWMNNVITGIRVDFANSGASGKAFEIDHVVVGYFGSALMPVDDDALPAPSNLIGNPMGAIADRHGRAQGWKPCEGGFEYDKIRYYSGRKALRCGTQTYTNQAIAYKAVAVSPHNVYRLRLLLSSEYVQTQGLYIRLQELNTEMPAGKTHIVHATWASTPHGVARTSYKEFWGNNAVDDEPQLFEYDYTPPAGVKYVSLAIYRWSGQPGWTGGAAANIWIHHAEFFVKEATSAIRNDSISLSSDGFMTYQDENGNPVSSGAVTRAGLGAESPSGAQARADAARTAAVTDAYNQAIASALLRNPSGEGMNFFPPMYQNPLPEVPFGGKNSTTTTTVVTNNQGQPSGGNIIGVGATGGDAWVNLSTSGDNMKIVPGKKWLIRFWVKNNSSVAAHSAQVYFSWSTPSGRKYLGATYTTPAAGASGYRQVVLDMRSSTDDRSSATAVYIRLDNDGGNGSMLYFDNFMVEPIAESEVNNGSPTPSPYSAPLGTAPILSNGYLPMNTNAGQSTQSIQPLATSKYNNAARITINAHTLYVGDLSISYSTGHIDGLAYSTVYYIYCDDPYSQGGTPPGGYKYVDAASYQDLSKSSGRYWIGAKKTVSSGGTTPPPDDDFNCVAEDMYLVAGLQAKDCQTGDILDAWNPDCGFVKKAVKHRPTATAMCIAIRTESGAYTEVSFTTPIDLEDGRNIIAANAEGEKLLVLKEGGSFCWEQVVSVQLIGEKTVVKINCGDVSYASGIDVTNRIVTHNAVFKP